jgi:hypothetical protein
MDNEEYIKNLVSANKILNESLLDKGFSEHDLEVARDKLGELIDQLEFWVEQDNSERFCYELKNHIQWMLDNYG